MKVKCTRSVENDKLDININGGFKRNGFIATTQLEAERTNWCSGWFEYNGSFGLIFFWNTVLESKTLKGLVCVH